MNDFLHAVGYGIVLAGIMGLAATGLALQVSITNFINFAFGDYLMLAGYFALTAVNLGANIVFATLVAVAGMTLFSYLSYLGLYGPLRRRGTKVISILIVSVGLSLVLQAAVSIIWGPSQQTYGLHPSAPMHIGPFLATNIQIYIVVFAAIALAALDGLLRFTKVGKALRAMSDNMALARASGIGTDALTGLVWAIMGAFAGLSGVMLAITVSAFTPSYGFNFLFLIFAVIIIGGIGNIRGTMVGALIVGVGISVAQAYISTQYAYALAFGLLIVTLLARPQGLFGGKLVAE